MPLFAAAARLHRQAVGTSWRVDEAYLRFSGRWVYAYRAINQAGQVVDVYVSARRNVAAARTFFERAVTQTSVRPDRLTTDKAGCHQGALRRVLPEIKRRTIKYLHNDLERDHGHLKQRVRPMRGFKNLEAADTFCHGHGLIKICATGTRP